MPVFLQKLMRLLESKAFLGGVLALCMLHAFGTGFYMPSIWTANYYTVNFFDGFFRRALIGTILYPFGGLRLNYHFIASVQLLVGVTVLVLLLRKLSLGASVYVYVYACIFFLSRYGAFFFNTQGYPEYVMYLMMFLACVAKSSITRVFVITASVWVHEMAVFTCLPLWFVLEYAFFNKRKTALVGFCLSFISFVIIYFLFRFVSNDTMVMYMQFISAADYAPKYHYVRIFEEQALKEWFRFLSYYYGKDAVYKIDGVWYVFLMALSMILSGCVWEQKKSMFAVAAVFLAALSPLLLGLFGFDVNRWVFLATINISVLFVVLCEGMQKRHILVFMLIACANLFLTAPQPLMRYYRNLGAAGVFILRLPHHMAAVPLH